MIFTGLELAARNASDALRQARFRKVRIANKQE